MVGYGAIGDGDSSQRNKVGEEEDEAGVNKAALLLAVPELLAHGHLQTGCIQVQVDGVDGRGRGQPQGGEPDQDHQTTAELASRSFANGIGYDDVTIHRDGHEGQDGRVHRRRLHDRHKVAHAWSEHPAPPVEGVGRRQRDAEDAHHQVDKRQVADQEVGGVVPLLVVPDEEEEEQVPGAGDQDHGGIEGDEEKFQSEQQVEAREGGD